MTMSEQLSFAQFVTIVRRERGAEPIASDSVLISFDPGEMTGYCVFEGLHLIEYGQLPTGSTEMGVAHFDRLFDKHKPKKCVMEDYRVYQWKTKSHAWSALATPRLIGSLETICAQRKVPKAKQMANRAKAFCTDSKLASWKMYIEGQKHARDAIRHGAFNLIFD